MTIVAIAFGVLVLLIIAMKLMRLVASGCVKLVVLAVLIGGCAAAYYYFHNRIVLP